MNILKNLPKWASALIALVLIIACAIPGGYHVAYGEVPKWAALLGYICGPIAATLGVGLIPVGTRVLLPLGLAALMGLSAGCGVMWRVTASIREAGTLVDKGIAAAHRVKRLACKKAHGAKTLPFAKCLTGSREHTAFQQWRRFGMPGLNSGLATTVMTLTLYDKVAGKKLSWELFVKLIKPLACGLSRAATAWKDLLKEKGAVVLGIVSMIKGVSCAE